MLHSNTYSARLRLKMQSALFSDKLMVDDVISLGSAARIYDNSLGLDYFLREMSVTVTILPVKSTRNGGSIVGSFI